MGNFISYELLSIVFNMSVTASAVIVFVLLARLLLKKAPKIFSYALWAVVLFRLICPVSITSGFSLLGLFDAPVTEATTHTTAVEYIPQEVVHTPTPEVKLPVPGVTHAVNEALPQGDEQTAADPMEASVALATLVWLAGIGVLAVYSVVSLLRLRGRLVGAVPLRDNIYLADYIETPFVMGILRPKIYLPSSLSEQEQGYIILHERHHIRRGDHIIKALAFLALCVHWFNPLVWAAFVLSAKDMEMSCDEAVVKKLGEGIRADYSASLLSLATGRRIIAGTPLAFGEGDTKSRIKNLLSWKKPRVWITVIAAVVCVAVVAACAANPQGTPAETPGDTSAMTGQFVSMEEYAQRTMDGKKTAHYYRPDGTEATANVTGTKLAWLEKKGEVEGLAPEGTLEAWTFNYLVQVDVDPEQIMLVGGMCEEDGWYDLEGQGGHNIVALRYADGSCDILYNAVVNDNLDFYGYHNSYEEAVYDWYVSENGLDLPLYVKNLTVGGEIAPAHRYDGDGWYIYIPVSGWEQARVTGDNEDYTWGWSSAYNTGAYLVVAYFNPEVAPSLRGYNSYLKPLDSENRVWEQQGDDYARRYFTDTPDGGCWRVSVLLLSGSTRDPGELEALYAMAESFTVDSRFQGSTKPPQSSADLPQTSDDVSEPTAPTAPPTEADIHAAIMTNHEAVGDENALIPFYTEAHNIWSQSYNEDSAVVYAQVWYATYDWQNGHATYIGGRCVPAKIRFKWNDGWQLSEYWVPPDDGNYEKYTASIWENLPADIAHLELGETDSDVYADLNARCNDAAIRYYAAQTGLPPAKTFTPTDVEFSSQALRTQTDTMTYEERLVWVQAGPIYDNSTNYTSLGKYREGEGCLVFLGQWVGTPHVNQYVFNIRFADGTIAYLPLAEMSYYEPALPDSMEFQNGKFVYETTFADELLLNEGQELIHLKGTYHYEVDLAAKTVSLTVFQR